MHTSDAIETPKTSVVIPVYNTEAYLEECLESILAQTQDDIEVILVDDGSTDGSLAIIDRYVDSYPFIRKIQQQHEFQGTARNRGLAAARGEFVYFMDSDDRIDPQLFARCYEACQQEDLDFVTFDAEGFLDTEDSLPLTDIFDRSVLGIDQRVWDGPDFWNSFYKRRGILYLCWLHYIRRDFLLENGLLFEERTYFEDNDWTLRLYMAAKRLRYLPEQLCGHRWRRGSNMNEGFTIDLMRGCFRMHDVLVRLYRENPRPDVRSMILDVLHLNICRFDRLAECAPDALRVGLLQEFVDHVCTCMSADGVDKDERIMHFATLRRILAATRQWAEGGFSISADAQVLGAVERLSSLAVVGKRMGVYGMGKMSDWFIDIIEGAGVLRADVVYLDTNAPTGGTHRGRPVYNIEDAPSCDLSCILVASTKYADEMTAKVREVLGDDVEVEQIPVLLRRLA